MKHHGPLNTAEEVSLCRITDNLCTSDNTAFGTGIASIVDTVGDTVWPHLYQKSELLHLKTCQAVCADCQSQIPLHGDVLCEGKPTISPLAADTSWSWLGHTGDMEQQLTCAHDQLR